MKIKTLAAAAFVAVAALASTGCSTVAQLEENARADRAANPAKYQEIPDVARAQKTQNEGGAAYPEFCTFGCPAQHQELTRNW